VSATNEAVDNISVRFEMYTLAKFRMIQIHDYILLHASKSKNQGLLALADVIINDYVTVVFFICTFMATGPWFMHKNHIKHE
jgi:hypothetical protein